MSSIPGREAAFGEDDWHCGPRERTIPAPFASISCCMAGEKPGFVNVDELMRQVTFEQAAAYYGVALPEIHRVGNEIRTRCFLNCGRREQTGHRALAIQAEHPAKIWRCHRVRLRARAGTWCRCAT